MTALIISTVFAVNGTAKLEDDHDDSGEAWGRETHVSIPAPGGVLWIENKSDGTAIRAQSNNGTSLEAIGDAEVTGDLDVTDRINNAKFRSGVCNEGNPALAVDMAGNNADQGEVHFGNARDDQWLDMWFVYSDSRLIGNYIKYDANSTTADHFNLTSSGIIVFSGWTLGSSAGYAYWDAANKDAWVYEENAWNGLCDYWSYDRRMYSE